MMTARYDEPEGAVMSITIRALTQRDFFAWLDLYEGYAALFDTPLDDERALRVWSWLTADDHPEDALIAVDEDGTLAGLAHFHVFSRPLANDHGLFIDDLYVAEGARERGVGTALVEAVRDHASQRGHSVVRWLLTSEDDGATKLYDRLGTRVPWTTYEIAL